MLVQAASPAIEPVSLDEARTFCRGYTDATGDDALISSLISSARQDAEALLQRSLITQGWRLVLDAFPGPSQMGVPYGVSYSIPGHAVTLERGTVQAVSSITYLGTDGLWATMPPANYVAELSGCPARVTPVFGQIWPITQPQIGSVKVDYTAGFGDTPGDVPFGIRRWILIRVSTIFNNREEVAVMNRGKVEILPYIDGLLDPWKVVRY
jgi:uncharacterized phiE125 gp8 family phage protein